MTTPTALPRIELDEEGRACRAFVPSLTRPGAEYELRHYPSGWCHEDTDCRGWVEYGHCYHIESMEGAMNELAEETRAITVQTSPLALMNDVDLHAIMGNKLTPVKEWTYSFNVKGQRVEGMAARGVQDAVRALSTQGEAIRCTDVILVKEDDTDAYFKAVAGRFAISNDGQEILTDVTVRAKRQPKYMRRQDGSMVFNEFWYEIGTTKAARNAVDAMLPTALREYMKAQARIAAAEQPQGPRVTQSPPTRTQPAPPQQQAAPVASSPTTDQRRRLRDLLTEAKNTTDAEFWAKLIAGIKETYPEAHNATGGLLINKLTDEQVLRIADGVAFMLEGGGPGEPPEDEALT